ncbi:MAG: VWA domain-containing protein [Acidobacteriia bacterium]|nr:VWA domain-containing protein [Terriglobia bacterium]
MGIQTARGWTARLISLMVVAGVVWPGNAARAQQGVAGDNPVVSSPNKTPPPDDEGLKQAPKVRVTTTLVNAPVTVLDSSGNYIFDLQEGDFSVLDNGEPQRIQSFGLEQQPLAAVIVVETNETVGQLLGEVHPLGSIFSSLLLGPSGEAAVVTYGNGVQDALDFTSDSDELETTLRELKPFGHSAHLNDALAQALSLLEKRPKGERRVIVAFSDGMDLGSQTSKEDVVRRATNDEVTIYGLGFKPARELWEQQPKAPPPDPLDTNIARPLPPNTAPTPSASGQVYQTPIPIVPIILASGEMIRSAMTKTLLEFYAGYTGGVYYSRWSKKNLQDDLNRIASEIHSQYELAYVPDTLNQLGFHRIQIQVRRPGVRVRTRAGYFNQGPNQ